MFLKYACGNRRESRWAIGSLVLADFYGGGVRKSDIVCLNSRDATYISVGQLHLIPIDFKLKSNIVSESIVYLDSCLF